MQLRAVILGILALAPAFATGNTISLAGEWRFRLDPQKTGAAARWQEQAFSGPERMFLPGSTDQAGYGTKTSGPEAGWLSRPYTYEGPAWYQKDVVIPESWRGKHITLFLERAHWQTSAWVDAQASGSQNSLATPHVYDLTKALTPGPHRITLCVDNTYRINVGRNAHSMTDHTQTNWNGIIGRIELRAADPVWIDEVALYPDIKTKSVRVRATIGNATGAPVQGRLVVRAGDHEATAPISGAVSGQTVESTLALGNMRLWDEFDPATFVVRLQLVARGRGGVWRDARSLEYGLREIATRDRQFLLNGRPTFLRGNLECNIFPMTGYPPTDVESWMRLFRTAHAYGLNHMRFHSACPPEAAFVAADRMGFMLHVELPVWTKIKGDAELKEFMRAEGHRILKAYGNHPSFTMMCLGNEYSDEFPFLDELVAEFKRSDPRRLYTFSADHTGKGPTASCDYYVGQKGGGMPMRIHGARFGDTAPSTDFDFSKHIAQISIPTVAHELGQWVTYPDYGEIASYTGVLKPRNLEAFRDKLAARGMLDQAADFQHASGEFAWLLYKEDIETALRTPHYGGVQLLQLQDFPGQGEALVGLLDSFWHSKGILKQEQFREFFSETVPLLRFSKYTWTNGETFTARAEVAHYGPKDLPAATALWSVRDGSGAQIASGKLPFGGAKVGSVTPLGEISLPLAGVRGASHLRVSLAVEGTKARNHWDVWVYPDSLDTAVPTDVTIAHDYDDNARKALAAGGKVLLLWPVKRASANTLATQFLPVFWSLTWFKAQPGTLGIFCDPKHPALASFPTDAYSNYQWWEITQPSRAFILNDTPAGFRPIIQVMDDFHRNHKLGAVFETRVGEGRLLVCSFDLESDLDKRPAARQLLHSLLAYMHGDAFRPAAALDPAVLEKLLNPGI